MGENHQGWRATLSQALCKVILPTQPWDGELRGTLGGEQWLTGVMLLVNRQSQISNLDLCVCVSKVHSISASLRQRTGQKVLAAQAHSCAYAISGAFICSLWHLRMHWGYSHHFVSFAQRPNIPGFSVLVDQMWRGIIPTFWGCYKE